MLEIQIKTGKFTDEQKNNLINFLYEKIAEIGEIIELSSLEKLIITDHFTDDVLRIQKEYGSREGGHTDQKDGVAVAKVLHTGIKDNSIRQTIVMNDYLLQGFFTPELAQKSFHLLHHELCHVHDNFYKNKIFTSEGRQGRGLNKLEHTLICIADTIWSEYVAVRLSSNSVPLSPTPDLFIAYLFLLIDSCKEKIDKEIGKYRWHGDIGSLFDLLQKETSLLFKIAATVQAYFDGLGLVEHKIANIVNEKVKSSYFQKCWIKQWNALKRLFNIYPNWDDVYKLRELGEAVQTCWSSMGIYTKYIENGDSIYVDVPLIKE